MPKIFTNKKFLVAAGVVLILLLFLLWGRKSRGPISSHQVYTVTTGDITAKLHLSGTIQPLYSADVASLIDGRIKEALVKDGDRVEKGQLLIRLSEEDLISKLETDRSKYLDAKVKLNEVLNWENSPTYVNSKSQLETARLEYEEKDKTYNQNVQLYKSKAISKHDLDTSRLELERARANLAGAQAQFADVVAKGNQDAVQKARSEFIAMEIAFQMSQAALAHKEILAPYTGIVSVKRQSSTLMGQVEKSLSENRNVTAGEILMTIDDQSHLTVDVQVDEFDIFRVHSDQPVSITIPALPKEKFTGKVVSISEMGSETGNTYNVRCQLDNPSPRLKVGMSAHVEIPLEEKKGVLLVPVSALVKSQGQYGVYLLGGKEPRFQPVQVGITSDTSAEITQGLAAGQKILRYIPVGLAEGG
ncbi:MAG: hypothetical protein DRG58_06960 [Deltaproteobacteria bacterium]|nr:MAG: hypothetical protein DRG58_06960 [Deltaproteobacteria bacterium]